MDKRSRILFFFWILSLSNPLQAVGPGNWLFGASAGFVRQLGTYDINFSYTNFPILSPTYTAENVRDVGSTLGVFTGYQVGCRGWLFGAEASIDWYNTAHTRFFMFKDIQQLLLWNGAERFKRSPTLGISGRIGFEMAPYLMAYVRLGLEGSRDKLSAAFSSLPVFREGVQSFSHHVLYRVVTGVGAETPLCFWPGMTFRFEYNYHLPCTRIETINAIRDGLLNPVFSSLTRPKTHVLKGSLVWHMP